MILIMLGAPATGKGTVASLLKEKTGVTHLSTGDMLRNYIKSGAKLAKEIREYMEKGELVPDELIIELVAKKLSAEDSKNGVILDGFPRTVHQAEELDKILAEKGKEITMVIDLESPENEIIERITTRRVCKECGAIFNTKLHPPKVDGICDACGSELIQRSDDTEDMAKNRLAVYDKETAPLKKYYSKAGKIYKTEVSEAKNRLAKEVVEDLAKMLEGK